MDWRTILEEHVRTACGRWITDAPWTDSVIDMSEKAAHARKIRTLSEQQAQIEKVLVHARVTDLEEKREDQVVYYTLHSEWLIRQTGGLYLEERVEDREAVLRGSQIALDRLRPLPEAHASASANQEGSRQAEPEISRPAYDRLKAVRYAELWWNRRNPDYPRVENDCTNFISQCLHAGGIPMWGAPVRSRGWWHSRTSWSYSWAVANSLRWYLSRSGNVMKAVEVDSVYKLVPGDVICYDFEGDGHWDHNTLVTSIAPSGSPLVNAHTYDARARDWAYTDSPAWTERINYKFFRIDGQSG